MASAADSSAEPPAEEGSVYAVVSALVINGALLLGLVCVFGALLPVRRLQALLAPHLEAVGLGRCPASWVLATFHSREDLFSSSRWHKFDARRATDLDAAVIVRFCMLGFKFSLAGSLVSCVLIPLYASGTGAAQGFSKYNLSNLEEGSNYFAAVVVAAYVLVFLFLHFAAMEWRRFTRLRDTHAERLALGCGDPAHGSAQAQRSVIVEHVPQEARGQDGHGVRRFFEEVFPGHGVFACVLQPDTRLFYKDPASMLRSTGQRSLATIRNAVQRGTRAAVGGTARDSEEAGSAVGVEHGAGAAPERGSEQQKGAEEQAAARRQAQGAEGVEAASAQGDRDGSARFRPFGQLGSLASGAAESILDTAQQLQNATDALTQEVTGELKALHGRAHMALEFVQDLTIGAAGSDTAFVTLGSVADRVVAEQLVLSHSGHWRARSAPEARDVYWPNASVSHAQRKSRSSIAKAALLAGLLFWSVPVATIQLLTSLEDEPPRWAQSGIGELAYSVLRKYLPVLGLMGLQYVLPEVFRLLAQRFEGYKVKSEIVSIVLGRNIRYQFATLWVTVISSTGVGIYQQFEHLLQEPSYLFEVLREEVPRVAVFFITFIAARAGLTLPMLLFKAAQNHVLARKPVPCHADYPREATNLALVLVLGLTYSVLAPAVMPVCAVYFGFAFVTYCWLFQNVYTPEFDCSGECWEQLFNASMVGLLVGTLTLAALSAVSVTHGAQSGYFYALLVLSLIVVSAHRFYLMTFAASSRFLSLDEACEVDRRTEPKVFENFREDYYVDPVVVAADEAEAQVAEEEAKEPQVPAAEAEDSHVVEDKIQEEPRDGSSQKEAVPNDGSFQEAVPNDGSFQDPHKPEVGGATRRMPRKWMQSACAAGACLFRC